MVVAPFDPADSWDGVIVDPRRPSHTFVPRHFERSRVVVFTPGPPFSWFTPLPENLRSLPRYRMGQPAAALYELFPIRRAAAAYERPMSRNAIVIAIAVFAVLLAIWFYIALR